MEIWFSPIARIAESAVEHDDGLAAAVDRMPDLDAVHRRLSSRPAAGRSGVPAAIFHLGSAIAVPKRGSAPQSRVHDFRSPALPTTRLGRALYCRHRFPRQRLSVFHSQQPAYSKKLHLASDAELAAGGSSPGSLTVSRDAGGIGDPPAIPAPRSDLPFPQLRGRQTIRACKSLRSRAAPLLGIRSARSRKGLRNRQTSQSLHVRMSVSFVEPRTKVVAVSPSKPRRSIHGVPRQHRCPGYAVFPPGVSLRTRPLRPSPGPGRRN